MEEGEDGREERDKIQNMLSSIVYSLGFTEEEVRIAITNWHSRYILPVLDSADHRFVCYYHYILLLKVDIIIFTCSSMLLISTLYL